MHKMAANASASDSATANGTVGLGGDFREASFGIAACFPLVGTVTV
jgi:hypothetical protein